MPEVSEVSMEARELIKDINEIFEKVGKNAQSQER